jgi:hypothetical protein
MRSVRKFAVIACGVALAGACGGSTVNNGTGDDGGTGMDSGNNFETGTNDTGSMTDGGNMVDSSGPPGDGGSVGPVHCGMATCNPPQVCCVDPQMMSEACTDPNACMGIPINCSGAASCPMGDVCCGSFQNMMVSVGCTPGSMCPMGSAQLCQMSSECPMGERCRMGPGGFRICRPGGFDGGMPDGGMPDGGLPDAAFDAPSDAPGG